MKKRISAVLLVLCLLLTMMPTAFAAAEGEKVAPELTTNIGEQTFTVGVPTEFTFSTVANDYAGVMVVGTSSFSDADAIEKLEYYEINDGKWYEFSGDFGPSTGFPMSNTTSKFCVTFKNAGEYSFTASMMPVDGSEALCEAFVEFTVSENAHDSEYFDM